MTGARAGRPETGAVAPTTSVVPSGRVMERGRSKAYRPLAPDVRRAAVERGLAAYGRGAWYLAHEELEPAWMGTDDPAERALLSGLIKLAAAYVHVARGNPLGVRTNLRGARDRLVTAAAAGAGPTGPGSAAAWIDLPALLAGIDDRLARIEALCADSVGSELDGLRAVPAPLDPAVSVPPHDVAGPARRSRHAPVAIPILPLPRRPA